ncbi:MAG TPA: TPM domain-containing protein [Vicinamibacteria bacterium]
MKPTQFVKDLDHNRIVDAIRGAETASRGEIRVHVAREPVEDARRAAAVQFEKLGMTATAERNGVLVYVAPASRSFAVIGDSGVHERCGDAFWSGLAQAMEQAFREGRFTEGIVEVVGRVGEALAAHFPRLGGADVNELPDEVSEG